MDRNQYDRFLEFSEASLAMTDGCLECGEDTYDNSRGPCPSCAICYESETCPLLWYRTDPEGFEAELEDYEEYLKWLPHHVFRNEILKKSGQAAEIFSKDFELDVLQTDVADLGKKVKDTLNAFMSEEYADALVRCHDNGNLNFSYSDYLNTIIRALSELSDAYAEVLTALSELPTTHHVLMNVKETSL
jgi:hypothetical protein